MDVKIRHKLIEIEDRVSDRFVILVTNYRWLRILEVIRYRRSYRPILKNTRQIYKIHSFIYERDFDNMSLVINFSIDKWMESMLRITSSQKCSLIHLVIPIISRGHDRGYINVYALFTSDSRFDRTNGPCSKQVLISCQKMSGEPILIQASYQ